MITYCFAVILASFNPGSSLGSTKNQLPDEERYSFFDAELLQVYNSKENGNLLISPISVKLILGMLMEGAEGRAVEEIQTALRLPEDEEAKRKEFSAWLSLLQEKESHNKFSLANWIFSSKKYPINSEYGKILKKYYSGGVTHIKFENGKEATQTINSWISNQTSHVITNIIEEDQINPDDKLILTSVVYFKGLWSIPFITEKSAVRCFYSQKSQCQNVRVMTETGYFEYGYISRLDAKAIVMPYQGKKFSMLLLLPTKRNGIEQLGFDLIHVSLKSILGEIKREEVFVQIPQFEITYNDDLIESLQKLRISQVFNKNSNLFKIFTNNTEISPVSSIYHSAKITVDESGSEAAVATAALFVPLMGGPTTSFVANHPFMFFLLDRSKNLVIFAGKVVTPKISEDLKKDLSHHIRAPKSANKKENFSILEMDSNNSQTDQGPKFRSIKPVTPLKEKTIIDDSPSVSTIYKSFASRPNAFIEKSHMPKKGGKAAQGTSKKLKRQEVQNDSWRHHVLIFT